MTDLTSAYTVTQVNHGFDSGVLICYDKDTAKYVRMDAKNPSHNLVGMVVSVSTVDTFQYTLTILTNQVPDIIPNQLYYLDPDVPGAMTPVRPTGEGVNVQPVFLGVSTGLGWVLTHASLRHATRAEQIAGTNYGAVVTSGVQGLHPSAVKSWGSLDGREFGGILASSNVQSFTRLKEATYSVVFDKPMASANYCILMTAQSQEALAIKYYALSSTGFSFITYDPKNGVEVDSAMIMFSIMGQLST